MSVRVDVHVFIDVLTRRMNWAGSGQVLHLVRNVPHLEGWTSALTIPLLYCFRLRVFPEGQARLEAQTAGRGFHRIALTQEVLAQAAASTLPDFEDNIQLASQVQPPVVRDSDQRPIVGVNTGVYIYHPHSVHAHEEPTHPSGRSLPRIFGPVTSPPVKEQSCSIPSGTDPIPSIFKVPTDKVKMCSRQ